MELFGYSETTGNVAVRTVAESTNSTVVWVADKYAIVHDGIPGMYTWNELSEIKTYSEMNGGVLYE